MSKIIIMIAIHRMHTCARRVYVSGAKAVTPDLAAINLPSLASCKGTPRHAKETSVIP
jgi:hypothetical protein